MPPLHPPERRASRRLTNGQPEEITTRHQLANIPRMPPRGRTWKLLQPGSPMSALVTRSQRWESGSSSISSIRTR
jgi:hypothetical protein